MTLFSAVAVLTVVVGLGGWLGGLYLLVERPPSGLNWVGVLHGMGGAAGFAVLVAALAGSPVDAHAVRMGAGGFARIAGVLICAALLAGLAILGTHLRRRTVPNALVATHGMLAITGYVLLLTYLTMLR